MGQLRASVVPFSDVVFDDDLFERVVVNVDTFDDVETVTFNDVDKRVL